MPLAKCVRCDNLFDKSKNPVCAACASDEDADYERIREVVDDQPDMAAEAVAELAEVPVQVVMRMLDQGMITNTSLLAGTAKCGRCGAEAISVTKKLCHSCLEKLNQNVLREKSETVIEKKKDVELGGATTSVRQMLEEKRR